MLEFHPLQHPRGLQVATIPRVRAADHWDWHNPRLSQALLGISRVLPSPKVPFAGLFSPGFGTALPSLGSWLWRGSFGRLETPWTENRERLSCSLPWLGLLLVLWCSEHHRLCQGVELLFWGRHHLQKIKAATFLLADSWMC